MANKKKISEFIEWFNKQPIGEIPNISKAQLILHKDYLALRRYFKELESLGCIKSEGERKNKKYFKIKNYGQD